MKVLQNCEVHKLILYSFFMFPLTWMTPPPWPSFPAKNSLGKLIIFPSQSSMTVSSSVQAGLAACIEK